MAEEDDVIYKQILRGPVTILRYCTLRISNVGERVPCTPHTISPTDKVPYSTIWDLARTLPLGQGDSLDMSC